MKKILLALTFGIYAVAGSAQCTDVIISEYVEGSGNNKGIELFNTTDQPIDLTGYTLERFSNGATTSGAGGVLDLTGSTIPAYSTFVIVNGQTTWENGGTSPPCDSVMQTLADLLDGPYPAPCYFNGNDALVLFKSGSTVIVDIFGKVGEDPGTAWTDDASAGYTDANGGTWWTRDQTLIRKSTVTTGVTNPSITEFNVTLEYDSLPRDTWTELNQHVCDCVVGVEEAIEEKSEGIQFYPSLIGPSGETTLLGSSGIKQVEIFNMTGQMVYSEARESFSQKVPVNISNAKPGIYLARVTLDTGTVLTSKIVKK